jgi:hypothetical protein
MNPHQSPDRIAAHDQVDWQTLLRDKQAMDNFRRDRASRYGRLAWKITKAAGFASAGLALTALGAPIGAPHMGVEPLRHATAEVIQIFEDPWD